MPYLIRCFFTSLSLVLFLCALAGCNTGIEEVKDEFTNYKFDQQVINKLPVYDSLAVAILENYAVFQKYINEEESYRAYRYMPSSTDEPEVFTKLPVEASPEIGQYISQLGKDLIYGFDLFKDSSIKIYVRTNFSAKSKVDIREHLSYYHGANIRRRDFPEKDSVLNKNWQYWARFDRRGLF